MRTINRKTKMWAVLGKCRGLRSIWNSKWQAESEIDNWKGLNISEKPIPVMVTIKEITHVTV